MFYIAFSLASLWYCNKLEGPSVLHSFSVVSVYITIINLKNSRIVEKSNIIKLVNQIPMYRGRFRRMQWAVILMTANKMDT